MLHRPGIEPGPPAWQASILPLNQRCFNEKDDESFEYLDFNIPKGQLISKCPFCCLQSCQHQQLETYILCPSLLGQKGSDHLGYR